MHVTRPFGFRGLRRLNVNPQPARLDGAEVLTHHDPDPLSARGPENHPHRAIAVGVDRSLSVDRGALLNKGSFGASPIVVPVEPAPDAEHLTSGDRLRRGDFPKTRIVCRSCRTRTADQNTPGHGHHRCTGNQPTCCFHLFLSPSKPQLCATSLCAGQSAGSKPRSHCLPATPRQFPSALPTVIELACDVSRIHCQTGLYGWRVQSVPSGSPGWDIRHTGSSESKGVRRQGSARDPSRPHGHTGVRSPDCSEHRTPGQEPRLLAQLRRPGIRPGFCGSLVSRGSGCTPKSAGAGSLVEVPGAVPRPSGLAPPDSRGRHRKCPRPPKSVGVWDISCGDGGTLLEPSRFARAATHPRRSTSGGGFVVSLLAGL